MYERGGVVQRPLSPVARSSTGAARADLAFLMVLVAAVPAPSMAEQNPEAVLAIVQGTSPIPCGAESVSSPACKPFSTDSGTVKDALTVNGALTVKTYFP